MSLTKVTYSLISGAPVNLSDYGATGNGTTDDTISIQNAINAASGKQLFWPKPASNYLITSGLTMTGHTGSSWVFEGGALINGSTISSSSYILTMTNCQQCDIAINASTLYNGVLIQQSGTGNSLNNVIRPYVYASTNRAVTKPATPTTAGVRYGIRFAGAATGYANYFNTVINTRLAQFECSILLENNANANFISFPELEHYWWGVVFYCQESQLVGGFGNVANGTDASNLTEFFRLGDNTNFAEYNIISSVTVEAGDFSSTGLIQTNANFNFIQCIINTPYGITDNGLTNTIVTQQSAKFNNLSIAPLLPQTSNGQYDVIFFGDGTTSQSGAFNSGIKLFGGGNQTRYGYIRDDYSSGNLILEQLVAGTIQLKAPSGQGVIVGDGVWNGNPTRLGAYYLWVDASGRLRIKSGVPTSDGDGVVVGTQT